MTHNTKWSLFALASLFFIGLAPLSFALTFTEVFANPLGEDSGHEWVELYGAPLPPNARFVEGGVAHRLALQAGRCHGLCVILIVDDVIPVVSDDVLVYASTFSLSNAGEGLSVVDNKGVTLAQTTYVASSREGWSVQIEEDEWFSAVPTPGRLHRLVPEFGLVAILFSIGVLAFFRR